MNQPVIALDARLVGGAHTGDSTYWLGLLNGLSQIEWDGSVLLFSNAPAPAGVPSDPRFRWLTLGAGSGRWWSLVKFPMAARKLGARAIHTQYNLSPLCGKIGITTIHDVSFFIGPEWFKPRDRALLTRFVPASARRAAKVLTVSQTSKTEIEKFIPAAIGKTLVTPIALNPGITPFPRTEAAEIVSSELGIATPYLLAVGTRWPRKNVGLAIGACNLLPDSLPHRLVLTGKPGWGDLPTSGRVVESGYVSERLLSALYSAADLYLLPSHHEGFGLTLLEAFACRTPVIASAGGAIPETAGDAAAIEESLAPADWARRIESLLADSGTLEKMRTSGLERLSHFSWTETAHLTWEAYREVSRS